MNTNANDRTDDTGILTIEELEARFEMEALNVAPTGGAAELDWKCTCSFEN